MSAPPTRESGDRESTGPYTEAGDFWEQPEQVEKFAGRDPDVRMADLLDDFDDPSATAVLDLGCAAGRNTVLLAREGFDVWAVDGSAAMVAETRRRVAEVLGPEEAARRVRRRPMTDLGLFPDAAFRLVVALGIYHNAGGRDEWERAVGETARVLAPGGRLLVAHFAPGTDLTGEGGERVPGARHLYRAAPSGALYMLTPEELDAAMARRGLRPVVPSESVEREMDPGRRIVVNALYRKRPAEEPAGCRAARS